MADLLKDNVALVTGAGRGIGREIALALASEGATVILTARTQADLEETAALVESAGGKALALIIDAARLDSLQTLTDFIINKVGRLDILVNNAGSICIAPLKETDNESYQRVMDVNARAPFVLCRDLLPMLERSPAGYIINIASVLAVKGYAMQSAYSASKHALRGMSMALAEELRDTNIRVHIICPGATATEMVLKARPDIPVEDLIEPAEIAELVHYLITHKGNAMMDELHIRRKSSAPWF
ncbi:MAG: SDR family oxidoreductase [Sedimentisphaerales bacterium]|nr:SDR family oxidoreductase [Sedimentisphaerales bacterium]